MDYKPVINHAMKGIDMESDKISPKELAVILEELLKALHTPTVPDVLDELLKKQ